ncbi:MAG: hypothetical protein V3R86_01945 [Candidatus Hydrothermarchaeaceae archaeon]
MGDDRGQLTIEGILLMGFFILIFVGITFPAALRVSSSSEDIASILEAQSNLDRISSAVEAVAAGQKGTVRTVTIVSNMGSWELNTNAPTDGINPTPKRPILNYEIGIWGSVGDVPGQLYRIRPGWGAITVLDIPGVSNGESASLDERTCSHSFDGEGTWDIRIENAANTSAPYIVFDPSDTSANCTASNTTINMYLVG